MFVHHHVPNFDIVNLNRSDQHTAVMNRVVHINRSVTFSHFVIQFVLSDKTNPFFGNLTGSGFHFKHRAVGSGSGGYSQMFIGVINNQNRILEETVSNVANTLQTVVVKKRIHKQTHTGNNLLAFQKDFLNLVVN